VNQSDRPVLWQLKRSVFSEKARFALDYKGIAYVTRDLIPGMHGARLRLSGKGKTVPVLQSADGLALSSSAIIAVAERMVPDPPLYPADGAARKSALELERFFDELCGHEVRRLLFSATLGQANQFVTAFLGDSAAVVRGLARAAFPAIRWRMRHQYGVDEAQVAQAQRRVDAAFDRIEELTTASDYLVADQFSVADVSAASLLAPLVMPPQLVGAAFDPDHLPPAVAAVRDRYHQRPGFEWVQEMYRRHRVPAATTSN